MLPPPFNRPALRSGEERDEFSPRMSINLPKEAHQIFYYVHVETVNTMYIYTNLLNQRANSGSAEQPIPSPIGKAPSQPKPHPSDRTV